MKFYVLTNPRVSENRVMAITDFVTSNDARTGEAPTCSVCGSFIGMLRWLPPFKVEIGIWGNAYGDISFGPGDELLVSEKFLTNFQKWKLLGLEVIEEVKVVRTKRRGGTKLRQTPPKYFCVKIVRSRAAIDVKASELTLKNQPTCDECRSGFIVRTKRIILEENTWSGEDIFFARGLPGIILTSDRFKNFFETNKINNGLLIPAENFSFDFYPNESFLK